MMDKTTVRSWVWVVIIINLLLPCAAEYIYGLKSRSRNDSRVPLWPSKNLLTYLYVSISWFNQDLLPTSSALEATSSSFS
jgi:hypothetical protein